MGCGSSNLKIGHLSGFCVDNEGAIALTKGNRLGNLAIISKTTVEIAVSHQCGQHTGTTKSKERSVVVLTPVEKGLTSTTAIIDQVL